MGDILLYVLGYIILKIKYPNKEKRNQVLENTYDGNLLNVGAEYPLKIVGISLGIGLLIFLGAAIYGTLFK